MTRRTIVATTLLAFVPVVALVMLFGCVPNEDISGVHIANSLPDTWITGNPPVLDRTDVQVRFHWSGDDRDGDIVGFQWKISDNGPDGIDVIDTLTVDPATGDTLHPWFFTQATDSIFFVRADSSNFPGDERLPETMRRFHQAHTIFIRAVDDDGAVDPSPAMMTFTAVTLAPTITLSTPSMMLTNYKSAQSLPPTTVIGWTGIDPDLLTKQPTKVRYLVKEARHTPPDGEDLWIDTEYEYNRYREDLISFSDPIWSDWIAYAPFEEDRRVTLHFEPTPPGEAERYYFFALQAQDTAGAVSLDLSYGRTVHNFRIDGSKNPSLTVVDPYLGSGTTTGLYGVQRFDVAQNQPVSFYWYGSADAYGGIVEAYRYGWDVDDVTNDEDPGWQVEFGTSPANMYSPTKVFESGIHTLVVEARDNSGSLSRMRFVISVVPIPAPDDVKSVLLIDDVQDQTSNGWPDLSNYTKYDNDTYRDQYWSMVLGSVIGWSESADVIDTEDSSVWGYREAVNYKLLVWSTRKGETSYISQELISSSSNPKFMWLKPYVQGIGNLFLVGSGATQNFYYNTNKLYPIVFTSTEGDMSCGAASYAMSFGTYTDSQGQVLPVGLSLFPYDVLGLSMSSMTIPFKFYRSLSLCGDGGYHITPRCAGTKAVLIDPGFKAEYVGPNAFPDTIYTWSTIDWADRGRDIPELDLNYQYGRRDEFFDYNNTERQTNWIPQSLPDGRPAIETMWRGYMRYDWILDRHLAGGQSDFPTGIRLSSPAVCGEWAIDPTTGRTRNDGVPLGVISMKNAANKPSGLGDMMWGFDPYRMEHDGSSAALRWVLEHYFEIELN